MTGSLLVTGGSRGIGAATALLAARRGYAVCLSFANQERSAQEVVAAIEDAGGRALAVRADVSREAEVRHLFDAAESSLGPLTAVVNNAGITGPIGSLADAANATFQRVLDVNVLGALLVARETIRRLSFSHDGQGGALVNVSSAAATLGSGGEYVWYAASKGAIDTLTVGLASEVGGDGIRVNAVSPGLIDTEIHASAGNPDRVADLSAVVPMGRGGTPEEVAEAIIWLLSDAASYINGANIRIGGGR